MKFIFTCGGTAGHINPALAVAGRLKELLPDSSFLFLGVNDKMEMELVPRAGYDIRGLDMTYIVRGHDLHAIAQNLETIRNVERSTREARRIIRDFGPDAVIGTGGYICYPVLTAAHKEHIPTLVHESNAVPGLTTKLLADRVDRVMLGFEESRQYYRHPERVVVTGTPVRGEFDRVTRQRVREELGLGEREKLVLSVWGSLGAEHMNAVMLELIPLLTEKNFRLIHVTGKRYYPEFSERLREAAPDYSRHGVEVLEYLHDMPRVMAASDLMICRAGASTLSELAYIGMPSILVPSPNVVANHQEKNARVVEEAGGARVLLEGEFTAQTLLDEIRAILQDTERLHAMSERARSLAYADATERICEAILSLT